MKIVAMIPMRLGSTRIPKKNIRYLLDKPLMQYPIELAVSCERFESVWVNTESEKLRPFVERLGARFHMRPAELALSTATNREFTYEFLQHHPCDYVVMLNTTSPLIKPETLERFLDMVESGEYETIVSVVSEQVETFFNETPVNFTLETKINNQLLEPVEKIVWALTAWKRDVFMRIQEQGKNPVFQGKLGRFVVPKDESCDLDSLNDWKIAEGSLMARQHIPEERYMSL